MLNDFSKDNFKFRAPIHIRWADIDALQHVNNAVYLNYFEQARIDYFRDVVGWKWEEIGMILANNNINYLKPLLPNDKAWVLLKTTKIGNKSFEMAYLVVRETAAGEEILTTATAVIVTFDYRKNITLPMPDVYRKAIQDYEGI